MNKTKNNLFTNLNNLYNKFLRILFLVTVTVFIIHPPLLELALNAAITKRSEVIADIQRGVLLDLINPLD